MNKKRNKSSGFTLIELMIVVTIIGILATLAIPRFMRASTKSKQSEAKTILKQIYVNERTYLQQSPVNSYFLPAGPASKTSPLAFQEMWIEIMPSALYTYTIVGTATAFVATATGNLDDDATLDIWTVDQSGIITNTLGNNDVVD